MFKAGDKIIWIQQSMRGVVIIAGMHQSLVRWEDRIEAWAFNKQLKLIEKKKSKLLTYWK